MNSVASDPAFAGRRIATDTRDHVVIRGQRFSPDAVISALRPFLSDERADRLRSVVRARSRSIVTVVEGVSNYGNVSAVMRTAEGLGFFEMHVVTRDQTYKNSRRASQGAEKWLDVHVWDSPAACVPELRRRGYQIAVTDSGPASIRVSDVDLTRKTAVVLGNELEGVSDEMRMSADLVCRVDMTGFVESYNISVAAGLVLYDAYMRRLRARGTNGDLGPTEVAVLEAEYALRAVQHAEEIVLESARRADDRL